MTTNDLERFVSAQHAVVAQVDAELSAGQKRTHWMWFVFPQIAGLGRSPTARFYALNDLSHARDYLAHPVLGPRLRQHLRLLLENKHKTVPEILGAPDDMKLRSCLTLFAAASSTREDRELFEQGLQQFFNGEPDLGTLERIREQ